MKEVKKVVIRWRSRIESTRENLKVDRDYEVIEPKPASTVGSTPGGVDPCFGVDWAGIRMTSGKI
jgi:hypothetical protein